MDGTEEVPKLLWQLTPRDRPRGERERERERERMTEEFSTTDQPRFW